MVRFCIHSSKYDPNYHTIQGGPYNSLSSCNIGCGTGGSTTTSTTTTMSPSLVSPPLINGNSVFNINDEASFIDIQIYFNNSWSPYMTIYLSSNTLQTIWSLSNSAITRARSSLNGATSSWSDNYSYNNTDNLIGVINGNTITNSNNFSIAAAMEIYVNSVWTPYHTFILDPNTVKTIWSLSNSAITRVRIAKVGLGVSVSAWSSN